MSPVVHSKLLAETVEYGGSMLRGAGIRIFATVTRPDLCSTELAVVEVPGTLSPDVSAVGESNYFITSTDYTEVKNKRSNISTLHIPQFCWFLFASAYLEFHRETVIFINMFARTVSVKFVSRLVLYVLKLTFQELMI